MVENFMAKDDQFNGVGNCPEDFFNGKQFLPEFAADYILNKRPMFTNKQSRDIYSYNEGIYTRTGEGFVSDEYARLTGDLANRNDLSKMLLHIRAKTIKDLDEINSNPELICVKNGLLNIYNKAFTQHTPKIIMLNKLPIEYDAKATCPMWEEFIKEYLPDEKDQNGMQEFFGYTLLRDQRLQKAFMLYGGGANGKTTMLEVLIKMLGEDSISHIELQKLDTDAYAAADLEGKLANVFMDIGKKGIDECRIFKQAVEGSPIDVQHKFNDAFTLRPYAKMIFSTNMLPEFSEDTDAVYRRWVIVQFTKTVDPSKVVLNYWEKFYPEIPGILNWALIGLERLLRQNKFSNDHGVEHTRRIYTVIANPVRVFLEENVIADSEGFIKKRVLYERLHTFCVSKKIPVQPENRILKTLRASFPYVEPTRAYVTGTGTTHVYSGINWASKDDLDSHSAIINGMITPLIEIPGQKYEQETIQDHM